MSKARKKPNRRHANRPTRHAAPMTAGERREHELMHQRYEEASVAVQEVLGQPHDWPPAHDPWPVFLDQLEMVEPEDLMAVLDMHEHSYTKAWLKSLGLPVAKTVTPMVAKQALDRLRHLARQGVAGPVRELLFELEHALMAGVNTPPVLALLISSGGDVTGDEVDATLIDQVQDLVSRMESHDPSEEPPEDLRNTMADLAFVRTDIRWYVVRWFDTPIPWRRVMAAAAMLPTERGGANVSSLVGLSVLASPTSSAPSIDGRPVVALSDGQQEAVLDRIERMNMAAVGALNSLDDDEDETIGELLDEVGDLAEELAQSRAAAADASAVADRSRRAAQDLEQQLETQQTQAATERREAAKELAEARAEIERLTASLANHEQDPALAAARAGFAQQKAEAEQATASMLEAINEEVALASLVDALTGKVRWLERRLLAAAVTDVPPPPVEEFAPNLTSEALAQASTTLPGVEVRTGDEPAGIDGFGPKSSVWARKAWLVLRVLDDYAEAKREGWSGDLFTYLDATPPGRSGFPRSWYAPLESDSVRNNDRYREPRTFAVPAEVARSGFVFAEAHVKLNEGSRPAPRLHLWDDTSGATGKVWVLYLGPHLPNGQTSTS